jgi:hypothetical protein
MIRQWIGVGFAVALAAAALSACSGKSAGSSKGDGCGTSSPSTGQCGGAASCGSPPCKQGCTLQIAVVAGYPDTCSGEPDPCDTFPDEPGCIMQGCYWSGGDAGGETCASDSGDEGADEDSREAGAIDSPMGKCVGTAGACSSFQAPYCPFPCFANVGSNGIPYCDGFPNPCDDWSTSSNSFGEPGDCNAWPGCMWQPD